MIISTEEQTNNMLKYLFSVMLLRDIMNQGIVNIKLLEKLNYINAEKLGCEVEPLI